MSRSEDTQGDLESPELHEQSKGFKSVSAVPSIRRKRSPSGNPLGRFGGYRQKKLRRIFFDTHGEHASYICWLCNKTVSRQDVTVDHIKSVKEWPEFAFEPSNLRPAHKYCNAYKDFWDKVPGRTLHFTNKSMRPKRSLTHEQQ